MATLKVKPSALQGRLTLPPSKSHTMRALLFGALGRGKTTLYRPLFSPDTLAMVQALRLFGVPLSLHPEKIEIEGSAWRPAEAVIDAGNSGQVLRFVGSLAALLPSYTLLTGDHSICHQRPVAPLLTALEQLGAFAISSRLDGRAPIVVRGPIAPGSARLLGEDSQPVSGLLMATSFLDGTTHLTVDNPGEKPWIDLTLSWLRRLGGRVTHDQYVHYKVQGPLSYSGFEIAIPGDFSSAAFPLVAACITRSELTLENLDLSDVQGDKKIVEILQEMGADLEVDSEKKELKVLGGTLKGISIDVNGCIDALPILAVLGCFAEGRTELRNGAIARSKESDRIRTIACELSKMGARIEERPDGLLISPVRLKGAQLLSHADHRIAMALGVAAMGAKGESCIEGASCIAKSYPTFVADFQKIGGAICLT